MRWIFRTFSGWNMHCNLQWYHSCDCLFIQKCFGYSSNWPLIHWGFVDCFLSCRTHLEIGKPPKIYHPSSIACGFSISFDSLEKQVKNLGGFQMFHQGVTLSPMRVCLVAPRCALGNLEKNAMWFIQNPTLVTTLLMLSTCDVVNLKLKAVVFTSFLGKLC